MQLTIIQIVILFLIVYVCLYGLVDRIMRCIEHCATAKAYSLLKKAGINVNLDGLERIVDKNAKDEFYDKENFDKK